jgi:hypothetical protein
MDLIKRFFTLISRDCLPLPADRRLRSCLAPRNNDFEYGTARACKARSSLSLFEFESFSQAVSCLNWEGLPRRSCFAPRNVDSENVTAREQSDRVSPSLFEVESFSQAVPCLNWEGLPASVGRQNSFALAPHSASHTSLQ